MKLINMPDARVGMKVLVTKGSEAYEGTVTNLAKPSKYVLYVDVETYKVNGITRDRWKRKEVSFGNSSTITVQYDIDKWQETINQIREARKRNVGNTTNVFKDARNAANTHFKLLGLTTTDSDTDIKAKIKQIRREYHEDIINQKHRNKVITDKRRDDLLEEAQQYTTACSYVEQYMRDRA